MATLKTHLQRNFDVFSLISGLCLEHGSFPGKPFPRGCGDPSGAKILQNFSSLESLTVVRNKLECLSALSYFDNVHKNCSL
jgi:hypothetical protein